MTQRQGTVKASETEKELIRQKINKLRWRTCENSQALVEASRILIIDGKMLQNYAITLEQLEELIDLDKIYVPKDKKSEYRDFKNKLKQSGNQDIKSLQIEDELIAAGILLAKNISYGTWNSFQDGKAINKSAFMAYWEALFQEKYIPEIPIPAPNQTDARPIKLYRALVTFNHTKQLKGFQNLASESQRFGAFLITGNCHYSRTWIMRRLDAEVTKYGLGETQTINLIDFASPLHSFKAANLSTKLGVQLKELPAEAVKRKNIILILKNVDRLNCERLNYLVKDFWQPLIDELPQGRGFFLMFLEDCGCPNDWREQKALFNELIEIPIVERFDTDEIRQGIGHIEAMLQDKLSSTEETIARLIQKSNNGVPSLILQEIYREFRCKLGAENRWKNYP